MDNQFCKNCGQANSPNVAICTKCGKPLTPSANNPFGVSNAIPAAPPPPAEKKNNKMFWILGIAGVLLILGIGLLGIVGIGSYFYFSSKSDVVYDYPNDKPQPVNADKKDDDDSLSDIDYPSNGSDEDLSDSPNNNQPANITNKQLKGFYKAKKSTVGNWKLQSVVKSFSKASFENRDAGVRASYKSGSKKLNHSFSFYKSASSMESDFDAYIDNVKSSGGVVRTTTPTSIIYTKGGLVYFAFHNPQGGLHEISSNDGKDILKYHDDYFDIKK